MNLQQEAYHHFGHDAQLVTLAEEAAELAAAICRHLNGKGDVRAIIEEVVGVESVAASLRDHLGVAREWAGVRAEQEAKLATKLGYDVDWSDAAGPRIINGPEPKWPNGDGMVAFACEDCGDQFYYHHTKPKTVCDACGSNRPERDPDGSVSDAGGGA